MVSGLDGKLVLGLDGILVLGPGDKLVLELGDILDLGLRGKLGQVCGLVPAGQSSDRPGPRGAEGGSCTCPWLA